MFDSLMNMMQKQSFFLFNLKQSTKLSTLNIIVKTAVPGDLAFEAMTANDVYNKEIEFYSKILPKINENMTKLNETTQLVAKPYGVCVTNNSILFEDLCSKGYRIMPVHHGLDFEEAKIVLKKAALLHAIHAMMQEEDPNIFEKFKYGKFGQRSFHYKTKLLVV